MATTILINNQQAAPANNTAVLQALQTILDIDLETSAAIDNIFDLANLNGIGITDDIMVGSTLKTTMQVLDVFKKNKPASNSTAVLAQPGGIGFMQIQTDFIVS